MEGLAKIIVGTAKMMVVTATPVTVLLIYSTEFYSAKLVLFSQVLLLVFNLK